MMGLEWSYCAVKAVPTSPAGEYVELGNVESTSSKAFDGFVDKDTVSTPVMLGAP